MLRSIVAFFVTSLAFVGPALAQDSAAAAAQFDRGLADMMAGKYETGCPALAESYALDPKPGALFTLAECEAKWGKIASAVTHYGEYLDLFARMPPDIKAQQRGRDKIATDQKAALTPDIPQLTIALPKGAPSGSSVKRDGRPLGAPSLGLALPTDPGEHVITLELPSGASREFRISLDKGDSKKLELELPSEKGETSEHPKLKDVPAEGHGSSVGKPLGFVLGALGLAGLAVGGVMGGLTLGQKSIIQSNCVDTACNPKGLDAASKSKTYGLVSTIGFAAGGALLVTGAVLVITSPKRRSTSSSTALAIEARPTEGAHGAALGMRGTW